MKLVAMDGGRRAERVLEGLERRGATSLGEVEGRVRRIVDDVRRRGDRALLSWREKLDGIATQERLRVPGEELRRAWEEAPTPLRRALDAAASNIADFAYRQMPGEWSFEPQRGVRVGQRVRAIGAVGCYVPSGRHPLPSTLLMTAVPAHVAGVREIVVVSPRPAPETLAAAGMLGIEHFYQIGGAQGIAALAYGAESIPRVEKIVGPGNRYVTAAKKLVAWDCAIDMLAGPTEIVVASESGDPGLIAADLVAQAEHDPEAVAVLITPDRRLARRVVAEVGRQSRQNAVAKSALARHGYALVTGTVANMREIANRLAPEHLTVDRGDDVGWVENAGSVFVGRWSAQPLGDYVSGPNHTLPTGGQARVRGGLSVLDFVKLITVQEYAGEGVQAMGPHAIRLAEAEGLHGHAEAIRKRGADA
jgi:histidinol dehydrogenase